MDDFELICKLNAISESKFVDSLDVCKSEQNSLYCTPLKKLKQNESEIIWKNAKYSRANLTYPYGSSIWRKTIIGQALLDALIDISNLHKSLSQENLFVILLIFDQIMSKVVAETKGSLNIRITSGNLSQYKSIDDTWIFVVKNIKLKLKTQHIFSPSIHIMATDYKK